jgi:hypothetical protein
MKILNISLMLSLAATSITGMEKNEFNKTSLSNLPYEMIGKIMDYAGGGTKGLNRTNKEIRKKYFEAKAREGDKGFIATLGGESNKFEDKDFKSYKVTIKMLKYEFLDNPIYGFFKLISSYGEKSELSNFISQLSKFTSAYGENIKNISMDLKGVDFSEFTETQAKSIAKSLKDVKELKL